MDLIIDQAIRENKLGEWICYTFAVSFVTVGVGVIVAGTVTGDALISATGSIAGILFWPAMREARQIRRENMAIRLLEIPLSKAATGIEAAQALRDAFTSALGSKKAD